MDYAVGAKESGFAPERKRKEADAQTAFEIYREIIKDNISYDIFMQEIEEAEKSASFDPVAIDQAGIDLAFAAEGSESLQNRVNGRNGLHTSPIGYWVWCWAPPSPYLRRKRSMMRCVP